MVVAACRNNLDETHAEQDGNAVADQRAQLNWHRTCRIVQPALTSPTSRPLSPTNIGQNSRAVPDCNDPPSCPPRKRNGVEQTYPTYLWSYADPAEVFHRIPGPLRCYKRGTITLGDGNFLRIDARPGSATAGERRIASARFRAAHARSGAGL